MRRTKRRDGRLSFVMAGLVTAFHYLRHGRACPGPKLMASRGSAIVMAGLVPAIHVSAALQDQRRGCRHKAGHDGGETVHEENQETRWKTLIRHGRACPGHPRLGGLARSKTWMPGIKPGMTVERPCVSPGKRGHDDLRAHAPLRFVNHLLTISTIYFMMLRAFFSAFPTMWGNHDSFEAAECNFSGSLRFSRSWPRWGLKLGPSGFRSTMRFRKPF